MHPRSGLGCIFCGLNPKRVHFRGAKMHPPGERVRPKNLYIHIAQKKSADERMRKAARPREENFQITSNWELMKAYVSS